LLEQLQSRSEKIPVLVVSMYEDPFYIEKAFKAGAKGYMLKRESVQKVGMAIRQILNGRIYASEDISLRMLSSMVEKQFSPAASNIRQTLSQREFQIFEFIGQGKKRQEIAEALHISDRTVDTHMTRIKEKLEIDSNAKLIHCAIKFFMKSY
ncbi:MAG: response regulator transcription factor, partial [Candidatus Omnitrophota bacterium]